MATLIAGGNWIVRGATFALWLLAAASAVTWGLKFSARASSVGGAPVAMRSAPAVDPAAVGRLLGASPEAATNAAPVVNVASRFSLVGVAARRSGGAALISVDGKPAKPFRVGSAVDEGIVLKSVEGRKAVLASVANGQPVLTLELPAPSTGGSSPAAGMSGATRGGFPGVVNGASAGGNPGGFASAVPGGFPGGYPGAVQGGMQGATTPAQRPPPIPMAAPAPMAAPR